MADLIQFKRGSTAARGFITPAEGEPLWDTDTNKLYVGDGVTNGGRIVTEVGNTIGYCASDQTSTTTSFTDISTMTIPVANGRTYLVRGYLRTSCSNGSPMYVKFTGPSGSSGFTQGIQLNNGNPISDTLLNGPIALSYGSLTDHQFITYTMVDNSGGLDGYITFSYAQSTAGAHTATVKKYSNLELVKIY